MALPDSGYEQHLADLATAWIEDHPAEAVRVLQEIGALERITHTGAEPDGLQGPVYRLATEPGDA